MPAEQDTGEVSREIELLKGCTSANIVQYLGSLTREGELWIIMEFCGGSSLADVMEARGRCLTEAQIAATMAGTLDGLSYLHNRTPALIHRDVKAGNLLLAEGGVIKLADFGVSASIGSTLSKRGTVIGTPFWMAPEVITGGPLNGYNTQADVWSLGITAIELAEGQPPNSEMHPMRAIFLIPTRPPPKLQETDRYVVATRPNLSRLACPALRPRGHRRPLRAFGYLHHHTDTPPAWMTLPATPADFSPPGGAPSSSPSSTSACGTSSTNVRRQPS